MYRSPATHSVVRSEGETPTDRSAIVLPDPVMDGHDLVVRKPAVTRWSHEEESTGSVVALAADHLTELGRSVAEAVDNLGRAGSRSGTAT